MDGDAKSAPRSFADFYPVYLSEHSNRVSRRLHFIGTSVSVLLVLLALVRGQPRLILLAVLQAYALAWIGHFFFEHNRPATFRHPLWSFMGDWKMWWDVLRGRVSL
jgi:hypothetical protein